MGVTAPVAAVGAALLKAAADAEEIDGKFRAVFKEQASTVEKWSRDYGKSVGRSSIALKEYGSSIQDTLVPLGFARDAAAKMSMQVVELATDLGSFNNLPTEQVVRDIQSAIVGNTETLRKYGVVANEAQIVQEALTSGLIRNKKELDANKKAQAIMQLLVKGTADAQGDAARTADSLTNQTRALGDEMKDLSAVLGRELIPYAKDFVGVLREGVDWFGNLDRETQRNVMRIAAYAAAVGPATWALGAMLTTVGKLSRGLGKFVGWESRLGAFFGSLQAGALASTGALTKLYTVLHSIIPLLGIYAGYKLTASAMESAGALFEIERGSVDALAQRSSEELDKLIDEREKRIEALSKRLKKDNPTIRRNVRVHRKGGLDFGWEEMRDSTIGELVKKGKEADPVSYSVSGGEQSKANAQVEAQISGLEKELDLLKQVRLLQKDTDEATRHSGSSILPGGLPVMKQPDPSGTGGGGDFSDEELERVKKLGSETAASFARAEAQLKSLEEAREAATQGVARFWEDMSWENQQGFVGDGDYFGMLQDRLREVAAEFGTFSAPWKEAFEDLQSVAQRLADEDLERVREQLKGSSSDSALWGTTLDGLIERFQQFPALVKHLEDLRGETDELKGKTNSLADDMSRWLEDFQDGIADAIVSGKNFSDVLSDVGNQLAKMWIKYALFGGEGGGGLLSFLLPKAHSGGVIGSDSLASTTVSLPHYHTGGIVGADEQMAVLQKGEGVFTPGQMEAMGGGTTVVNVSIRAVDARSVKDLLEGNKGIIEGLVVQSILRNGAVRGALSQA